MDKKLHFFQKFIENGEYFSAHEILEEIWFKQRFQKDPEIALIKGLINAAVSFELYKRGREENSKKVWKTFIKYKKMYSLLSKKQQKIYKNIIQYLENHQQTLYNSKKTQNH